MAGERYRSFGLATPPQSEPSPADEAIALMKSGKATKNALLAYGNGRSYGDSCQNEAGTVVDMRPLNRIVAFNAETGLLEAEAGVFLSDIIAHAAPYGFFPAVVPGTQFVTLGGAIANDVHGKNHHRRGTFGCHVEALHAAALGRSDLSLLGNGQCQPVPSDDRRHGADRPDPVGLDPADAGAFARHRREGDAVSPISANIFDLAEAADQANEYAVAWIDQLAGGHGRGRGLLFTGNHAEHGSHAAVSRRRHVFRCRSSRRSMCSTGRS